MAQELGIEFNSIQIPPEGMERSPWAYASNPGFIDANKIKNLEVDTITVSPTGYIRSGKTSFTDSTNAGWYQSAAGVYFGAASDASKFKYDISLGTIDFIGAHSSGTVGGVNISTIVNSNTTAADIVPTSLAVSSTGVTSSPDGSQSAYVVLTWTAIATSTFNNYVIRYKKHSLTYYTYVNTTVNTLTLDGLTPNTSYDFAIASINKYGTVSSFSSTLTSTTAATTVAPATVTSGSATAGIQYIIVEWTHNTEADLASYNIYRNTTDNSGTATLIGNCRTNYFVDGGRTGGQIYYYWIKAINTSGLLSASFSTVVSATPRNVTSDDIVTIAGSKVLIDGTTYLSNWRNGTDLTKIDGGNIYTGTVTTTQLNFTPVQSTDVIASINASAEGIKIDADNLRIGTSTNYWDISTSTKTALTATSTDADVIINYGKTDFGDNTTAGFILGYDYSATTSKFEMGSSATKLFKYDGTDISLIGGSISGGTITIGTGDDVFIAGSNGIQLGDATFADAPFQVDMAGNAKVKSLARDDFHLFSVFESVDGYFKDIDNDGSVTAGNVGLNIVSGTTTNNKTRVNKALPGMTWDKNKKVKFSVTFGASINQSIYLATGDIGSQTDRHFGFRVANSALYSDCADGTYQNGSNLGITISAGSTYVLEAIYDYDNSEIRYYVNGTLEDTMVNNIPTGNTGSDYYIHCSIENLNGADGTKTVGIGWWDFWQAN